MDVQRVWGELDERKASCNEDLEAKISHTPRGI
jgi:hypothetical protein